MRQRDKEADRQTDRQAVTKREREREREDTDWRGHNFRLYSSRFP